jgi:hypothetical protein
MMAAGRLSSRPKTVCPTRPTLLRAADDETNRQSVDEEHRAPRAGQDMYTVNDRNPLSGPIGIFRQIRRSKKSRFQWWAQTAEPPSPPWTTGNASLIRTPLAAPTSGDSIMQEDLQLSA